jgi:hypothetical protein
LLPAPTKWRIAFGERMSVDAWGPEAAEDELLVGRLADRVKSQIQEMLDRMTQGRRSVWY